MGTVASWCPWKCSIPWHADCKCSRFWDEGGLEFFSAQRVRCLLPNIGKAGQDRNSLLGGQLLVWPPEVTHDGRTSARGSLNNGNSRSCTSPYHPYSETELLLLLLLLSRFSRVWLCATPQTAAHQAPPSLGFSRQEYWSGLPFPSPMHESEKWKWSCSVVSNSSWPHGLQPTSLLHPCDFPGKSTGAGCHCFLLCLLLYYPNSPISKCISLNMKGFTQKRGWLKSLSFRWLFF